MRTAQSIQLALLLALGLPSVPAFAEDASDQRAASAQAQPVDELAHRLSPEAESARGRAWIGHVPMNAARVGLVKLRFDVRGADLAGRIVVYYRGSAEKAEARSATAARTSEGVIATLDLSRDRPPSVQYWVVEELKSGERRAVFASEAEPHTIALSYDPARAREERALARTGGRRSALGIAGEYVDLGGFERPELKDVRDRYAQGELRYTYHFFGTLDSLRVGLGMMRGDVLDRSDPMLRQREVGLNYGRAQLTIALGAWGRMRAGLLLGVSKEHFEGGLDNALILGDRDGTAVELRAGFISGHGASGGVRLGWNTVPKLPMGATVEVTSYPSNDEAGVRMLYDIGYEFSPGSLFKLTGGYRGRTSLAGGPSLGADLEVAF